MPTIKTFCHTFTYESSANRTSSWGEPNLGKTLTFVTAVLPVYPFNKAAGAPTQPNDVTPSTFHRDFGAPGNNGWLFRFPFRPHRWRQEPNFLRGPRRAERSWIVPLCPSSSLVKCVPAAAPASNIDVERVLSFMIRSGRVSRPPPVFGAGWLDSLRRVRPPRES